MILARGSSLIEVCFDDTEIIFENHLIHDETLSGVPVANGPYIILVNDDDAYLYELSTNEISSLEGMVDIQYAIWASVTLENDYLVYSTFYQDSEGEYHQTAYIAHLPTNQMSMAFSAQSLNLPLSSAPNLSDYDRILFPTWSKDGTRLAIHDLSSPNFIIPVHCISETKTCEVDGEIRSFPSEDNYSVRGPLAWSPVDDYLAAVCVNRGDSTSQICVFDGDGNLVSNFDLTAAGLRPTDYVSWSQDGRLIAIEARDTTLSYSNVYVIEFGNMDVYRVLSSETDNTSYPVWISD